MTERGSAQERAEVVRIGLERYRAGLAANEARRRQRRSGWLAPYPRAWTYVDESGPRGTPPSRET